MSEIADKVRAAGVVGAGGAGFPTHVKLQGRVDIVIANGTECEPLLRTDQHLFLRHPDLVLEGVRLSMDATGAARGILALKAKYTDCIAALKQVMARTPERYKGIEFYECGSFYPAGDEFVLVHDATGRQVPEGGIPLAVGVLVQNVSTLANITLAQRGIPVTTRLMTVTGAVVQPKTLTVPLGTSLGQVLEWAGGLRLPRFERQMGPDDFSLVVGGAMMGRLAKPDDVTTKTMGALLVLPNDGAVVRYQRRRVETNVRRGRSTCDQCRDCTDLCPRFLLGHELKPHEVMRTAMYGLTDHPEHLRTITAAALCCECRLCEAFACPLELSPCAAYIAIKRELRKQGWTNTVHRRASLTPHTMREFRRVPVDRLIDRLGLTEYAHREVELDRRPYAPRAVRILLQQHVGAPAEPVVRRGDRVAVGALVGRIPEGALGANVHASIAGVVREVTLQHVVIEQE